MRAYVIDFGGHWKSLNKCVSSPTIIIIYQTFAWLHLKHFMGRYVKPLVVNLAKDVKNKVKSIQAKLLAAQSRQKKYVDHKVRDIAFQTSEQVLWKVSPM